MHPSKFNCLTYPFIQRLSFSSISGKWTFEKEDVAFVFELLIDQSTGHYIAPFYVYEIDIFWKIDKLTKSFDLKYRKYSYYYSDRTYGHKINVFDLYIQNWKLCI